MTPQVAIFIYKTVKGVSGRAVCLLKEKDISITTAIMLCKYVTALARAEETLFLYLNNALLMPQKDTKSLEEEIREDIYMAVEIEAEIKLKTNLSFEIH